MYTYGVLIVFSRYEGIVKNDKEDNACTICPINTYTAIIGEKACKACPANSLTDIGNDFDGLGTSKIVDCLCKPGFSRVDDTCVSCKADQYKDVLANEECTACPLHSTTMEKTTSVGVDACICDVGYYRHDVETYFNADTQELVEAYTECLPCATDTFRDTRLDDADAEIKTCTACPSNSSTVDQIAQAECVCMPGFAGTATGPSKTTCSPCDVNTFKYVHGNAATCNACPSESSTDGAEGQQTCDCDEGWHGDIVNASSTCSACPADTFKEAKGSMECTPCTPNSNTQGEISRVTLNACICDEGYSGDPQRPEDRCFACPFAWYKDAVGPGECTRCPSGAETSILLENGKKQKQMAATRLHDCVCSEGFFPDPDRYTETRISCKPCAVNWYSESISALAVPSVYKAALGQPTCTECPALSNTDNKMASSSIDSCRCTAGHEALSFKELVDAGGQELVLPDGNGSGGSGDSGEDGNDAAGGEGVSALRHKCSPCLPNFYKGGPGNGKCAPCAHLYKAPGHESLACVPYEADEVQDAFKKAENELAGCNQICETKKLKRETRTVEAFLLYWEHSATCETADYRDHLSGEAHQEIPNNIVPLNLADDSLSPFYAYEQCGVRSSEWHTCPPSSAVAANASYNDECHEAVSLFVSSLETLVTREDAVGTAVHLHAVEDRGENFTVNDFTPLVRSQLFRNKCFLAKLPKSKKHVSFRVKCGVVADLSEYRKLRKIDCMGPAECGWALEEVTRMKASGRNSTTSTTTVSTTTTTYTNTSTTTTTSTTVVTEPSIATEKPKVPLKGWHVAFIVIDVLLVIIGAIYWGCKIGYLHMPKLPKKETTKEIGYGGHFGMLGAKSKEVRDHGQTVAAQMDVDGDVYGMATEEEIEMRTVYPGGGEEGNYGMGNTALPADEVYGMAQAAKRGSSDDPNATYGLGAAAPKMQEATYGLGAVDGDDEFHGLQAELHARQSVQSEMALTDSSGSEGEPEPVSNVPAPSPYVRPETTEEGNYGLGIVKKKEEDTYGLARANDEGTYGLGYAPQAMRHSDSESSDEGAGGGGGGGGGAGDNEGTYGLARVAQRVGNDTYGLGAPTGMRRESEL